MFTHHQTNSGQVAKPGRDRTLRFLLFRVLAGLALAFLGWTQHLIETAEADPRAYYQFAVTYLAAPTALLLFRLMLRHERRRGCDKGALGRVTVVTAVCTTIVVLISANFLAPLANALTGSGKQITFSGVVLTKAIAKNRRQDRTRSFQLVDAATQSVVRINCDKDHYAQVQPGDHLTETFYLGGLGLPYRWLSQRLGPQTYALVQTRAH